MGWWVWNMDCTRSTEVWSFSVYEGAWYFQLRRLVVVKCWYTCSRCSIMCPCSFITEFLISLRGICIQGTVSECNLPATEGEPGPDSGAVGDTSGPDELMPGLDWSADDVPEPVTVPRVDKEQENYGCNLACIYSGEARFSASCSLGAKISGTGGSNCSLGLVEYFPACATNTVETWPLSQRGGCNTKASQVSM